MAHYVFSASAKSGDGPFVNDENITFRTFSLNILAHICLRIEIHTPISLPKLAFGAKLKYAFTNFSLEEVPVQGDPVFAFRGIVRLSFLDC